MKFIIYDLVGTTPGDLGKKKEILIKALESSRTKHDDKNLKYCLNNLEVIGNIIGGTLSQEHIGGLKKVNPENKKETPLESSPWEKTYFFIDIVTAKVLLQKRRYSPRNLDHGKTERRLHIYLREIFLKYFNSTIEMVSTLIGQNNEYFKEIIRTKEVHQLEVNNLLGKKIPLGSQLHNPREDWDKVWAESWNTYDSNYIDDISIKAPKGKDLGKSVIKKAITATDADIKKVTYFDSEEEKPITVTKNSVASVYVDANNDDEHATIMKLAFEKIERTREVYRKINRK